MVECMNAFFIVSEKGGSSREPVNCFTGKVFFHTGIRLSIKRDRNKTSHDLLWNINFLQKVVSFLSPRLDKGTEYTCVDSLFYAST